MKAEIGSCRASESHARARTAAGRSMDPWGHTHCCDYEPVEGTRVLCNPQDYVPSDLNEEFNPYLVVEV